jgi:hypothetical protein
MCMFSTAGKMPVPAYPSKPPATTPSPTAPSASAPRGSSFGTYKSSPFNPRPSSISAAGLTDAPPSYSTTQTANNEQEEEAMLEEQAQRGPDYVKKRAEKDAFTKTYASAIRETSGNNFNMEYLHPESGQSQRAADSEENPDEVEDPEDWDEKPPLPKNWGPPN